MLAMLCMTTGLVYNMFELTSYYLSYPVSVTVSVVPQQRLVFPAVTLCNLSPVKRSAVDAASLGGSLDARRKRRKRATGLFGLREPFY